MPRLSHAAEIEMVRKRHPLYPFDYISVGLKAAGYYRSKRYLFRGYVEKSNAKDASDFARAELKYKLDAGLVENPPRAVGEIYKGWSGGFGSANGRQKIYWVACLP